MVRGERRVLRGRVVIPRHPGRAGDARRIRDARWLARRACRPKNRTERASPRRRRRRDSSRVRRRRRRIGSRVRRGRRRDNLRVRDDHRPERDSSAFSRIPVVFPIIGRDVYPLEPCTLAVRPRARVTSVRPRPATGSGACICSRSGPSSGRGSGTRACSCTRPGLCTSFGARIHPRSGSSPRTGPRWRWRRRPWRRRRRERKR